MVNATRHAQSGRSQCKAPIASVMAAAGQRLFFPAGENASISVKRHLPSVDAGSCAKRVEALLESNFSGWLDEPVRAWQLAA
ncbi:hypothetical protein Q31a_03090 [Aureliella helgolandensis]|uniref:Uncharacterized protein n=1 Tax=Aureliella helgolandensis TaxID=2527968 RepID=A0A518G0G3_9BACT|nr:hypothetical protein Q31a_03090 [Aureliella helgolandensis]